MPLTEITLENLDEAFDYKPWNESQQNIGRLYKDCLKQAARVILENVPRSPLRTRTLNALADVRMLGNAAITHEGVNARKTKIANEDEDDE